MNQNSNEAAKAPVKLIIAYFWPQGYWDHEYRDCGDVIEIDVTAALISLDAEAINAMEDDTDSTNDLVTASEFGHDGPHQVAVVESICEYFDVDDVSDVTQSMIEAERAARARPASGIVVGKLYADPTMPGPADWRGVLVTADEETGFAKLKLLSIGTVYKARIEALVSARYTDEELASKVMADYEAVVGNEIEVCKISGYDENDNSHDIVLTPPAKVRVLKTDRSSIVRWCDEWMDPCWDVEAVDAHPQLEPMRSLWVYGISYHPDGGTERSDLAQNGETEAAAVAE